MVANQYAGVLAVHPIRAWKPAGPMDARVETCVEDQATHHVKLADGTMVPLRIDLNTLAKQLPEHGELSPEWQRAKDVLIDTGVTMVVVVAAFAAIRVFAMAFAPVAH